MVVIVKPVNKKNCLLKIYKNFLYKKFFSVYNKNKYRTRKGNVMQARRAARELALILFSQFDKEISRYNQTEFEDIILKSVRTLTNNAIDELKVSVGSINAMKEFVDTYEAESPENLSRPIRANNVPVALPMTSDLSEKLNELLNISEKVVLALEIAEMTALEQTGEVKNYVLTIAQNYKENSNDIDSLIRKFAKGWDLERLVKIDKDILRIAISELLYSENVPVKVVVDEALELAKKYSTDDSSSFINGILGKVIEEKKNRE